jgi:predicted small lipoprotein YifL
MELTEKDIDQIRDYWQNRLSVAERQALEQQMAQDPAFSQEVQLQKYLLRAVQEVADERLSDLVRDLRATATPEHGEMPGQYPLQPPSSASRHRFLKRLWIAILILTALLFIPKFIPNYLPPADKNTPAPPAQEQIAQEPIERVVTAPPPLLFSIPPYYARYNLNLLKEEALRARAVAAEPANTQSAEEIWVEQCQNALADDQYQTAWIMLDTFFAKRADPLEYPRLYYYSGVLCLFGDFPCDAANAVRYLAPLSDLDLDGRSREYYTLALWKAGHIAQGNQMAKKLSDNVRKRWKTYKINPPRSE